MATGREVYFEMQRMGAYVKVVAIDSLTGVEASIVGSALARPEHLKATALRKLQYVLGKQGK